LECKHNLVEGPTIWKTGKLKLSNGSGDDTDDDGDEHVISSSIEQISKGPNLVPLSWSIIVKTGNELYVC